MEALLVYWLPTKEMDTVTRVQIMDEIAKISRILGKGMNSYILPPAMSK